MGRLPRQMYIRNMFNCLNEQLRSAHRVGSIELVVMMPGNAQERTSMHTHEPTGLDSIGFVGGGLKVRVSVLVDHWPVERYLNLADRVDHLYEPTES
ncbi:hypothetical protein, partial [Staphylococcus aureus]|uniref:hypothetical protein n=1 Tax=Staphylococcus aureus TaxID=1280 RepID=UPI0019D6A74C